MKNDIKKDIIKEYHNIIKFLIEKNMVIDNIEFRETNNMLTWSGKDNTISNILYDKNISAEKIIETLRRGKQYSILLKDKSVFQIEYTIENNTIIKQRMLYMKLSKEIIDDTSEESMNYDEEKEILEIPLLIRVDYDLKSHKDIEHPASHMTISNIEKCRIPIKSNMSFLQFVKFILMNVYGINYNDKELIINEETITDSEKKCIHINWIE